MSERVTWLLPVKNGMPYLPEALASIEAQTYRNWEVLAWDNGSTDGTIAELHKWIPSRLPGRVITDNPLSLGNSLARLVESAQTELCARIDADDINHPERLEQQVAFLLERPEVAIVGADIEFIDENGRVYPGAWVHPEHDAEVRWRTLWKCSFNHPTVLYRRSVVLAAGNYADCKPGEDYDLWLRIARIAEVANIPRVLVKYRQISTSFMAGWNRDYDWMFDLVAARNADFLFSGMSGPSALELRRKVLPQSGDKVNLSDLVKLHQAATATALAAGKPTHYFRSTDLYSEQQRTLLSKWLMQRAWGRVCLTTKRKIRSSLKRLRLHTIGS